MEGDRTFDEVELDSFREKWDRLDLRRALEMSGLAGMLNAGVFDCWSGFLTYP